MRVDTFLAELTKYCIATVSTRARSEVLQSCDLVAAQAATAEAFALLCESDAVDVITIDLSNRLPFHIAAKHTAAALARNINFEVRHARAAIVDKHTPVRCIPIMAVRKRLCSIIGC